MRLFRILLTLVSIGCLTAALAYLPGPDQATSATLPTRWAIRSIEFSRFVPN